MLDPYGRRRIPITQPTYNFRASNSREQGVVLGFGGLDGESVCKDSSVLDGLTVNPCAQGMQDGLSYDTRLQKPMGKSHPMRS